MRWRVAAGCRWVRAGAAGGLRPPGRCRAMPGSGSAAGRSPAADPPRRGRPAFLRPQAPPHIADGCRLGMGEAGAVGYAPGRRRLAAGPPRAAWPAKPNGGPGHRPGPPFQGASRPAAAPPGRWDFAPPPGRGRQGGKPGRSAGPGMAEVGPGLSGLLRFCKAVFLWPERLYLDFLGNKGRIYKLRLWCAGIP